MKYAIRVKQKNRPEPWVEIDAEESIKNIYENNDYNIECIREYICDVCILAEQDRLLKLKQLQENIKEQMERDRLLKIEQIFKNLK